MASKKKTKMPSSRTILGNGLALLSNKAAAGVFDISSNMVHASMRDQIVRAQLLVRDLFDSDPGCEKILIVGAGVGGLAAAATASYLGIEAIVVEAKDHPLALQHAVTRRFVGPFMYEWPDAMHDSQNYPLTMLVPTPLQGTPAWVSKTPMPAQDFATHFLDWWNNAPFQAPGFSGVKPQLYCKVDPKSVCDFVLSHKNWAAKNHNLIRLKRPTLPKLKLSLKLRPPLLPTLELGCGPDYVILAAGMGDERIKLASGSKGLPFWHDDDFKSPAVDNMVVGVFGGGDGALQDVLRLCTRFEHPLKFIELINQSPQAKKLLGQELSQLQSLEQQSRVLCSWAKGDTLQLIDRQCRAIAQKLVINKHIAGQVRKALRPGRGKVLHFVREAYFGKAYLLNRFCVHLLNCYMLHYPAGNSQSRWRYQLAFNASEPSVTTFPNIGKEDYFGLVASNVFNQSQFSCRLDRIAVRYGIEPNSLPGRQLIKLEKSTANDRISISGVPLPFVAGAA